MKKQMKTLALAIMGAISISAGHAMAENLKIGIAGEPYPPFTMKQANGKFNGFEIDLVDYICNHIKAKCDIVETAWDGIIPALQSKKIDVIFNSMRITPVREKTIAFSIPYYDSPYGFMGAKGLKKDISPAALAGKTLGAQSGTTAATFLTTYYQKTSTVKLYNTQEECNADLANGRIDLVLIDSIAAASFLKTKDGEGLEPKGLVPKDAIFGPGVGAGMRKDDVELKKQFDGAIKQMISSGAFNTIQKKYFDTDLTPR